MGLQNIGLAIIRLMYIHISTSTQSHSCIPVLVHSIHTIGVPKVLKIVCIYNYGDVEEVGTGNRLTGKIFCKLEVFGCHSRSLLGCFSRSGHFWPSLLEHPKDPNR